MMIAGFEVEETATGNVEAEAPTEPAGPPDPAPEVVEHMTFRGLRHAVVAALTEHGIETPWQVEVHVNNFGGDAEHVGWKIWVQAHDMHYVGPTAHAALDKLLMKLRHRAVEVPPVSESLDAVDAHEPFEILDCVCGWTGPSDACVVDPLGCALCPVCSACIDVPEQGST